MHDKAGERILERSLRGACRRHAAGAAARRSTRTTATARATPTAPTRTTWSTGRRRSPTRPRPDAVLRHAPGLHRRGQGRLRGKLGRRTAAVPAHPARRLLRDRGRARDHAEAADHQHARRAARRPGEVPAAARDRRRRQPLRGGAVPEGRDDRDRARDDRGRLPAGPLAASTRSPRCTRSRTTSTCRRARADRRTPDDAPSSSSASTWSWRGSTSTARTTHPRTARCSPDGRRCSPASRTTRWLRRSSTGSPSTACSRATVSATASAGSDPKLRVIDLQYHDVRRDQRPLRPPGRHREGRAAHHRRGDRARRSWSRPRTPARTSGAGASRGIPTRSPPPRGTRSSSTPGREVAPAGADARAAARDAAHVEELLEASATAADLIDRLQG